MTTAWDGRCNAWGEAWARVQSMRSIREQITTDNRGKPLERTQPLPEEYWGMRAEAELLTDLARADVTVGFTAGGWLEQTARAEAERAEAARVVFADNLFGKKKDKDDKK